MSSLSAIGVALVIAIPSAVICILGIVALLWYNRYHNRKAKSGGLKNYVEVGKELLASNFQVDKTKKLKDIIDSSMSGKFKNSFHFHWL